MTTNENDFDFFAWLDAQPKRPPVPGKAFRQAAWRLVSRIEDDFVDHYHRLYASHTAICQAAMELADKGGPNISARQKIRQLREASKLLRDSCQTIP